jgi:ABC-type transport system substrate-binding protein
LAKWDWRGCWNNQEFQDLKAELLETVDRAAQLEIYNEMQRVFMADPSFIFHGEIPFVHAYDADLKGYKQLTLAGLMMVGMWWENPTRR